MSAVMGLLAQMDETRKRLQGGLTPPADAFQVPQEGPSLHAPGARISAPPPPTPPAPLPTLGQAPPSPALPVANPTSAEALHQHRKGITGGLMHLMGADKMTPELASLLTPNQQAEARPGLLRTLYNAVQYRKGPQTVMQERAMNTLGLIDKKTARDKQMRLAELSQMYMPAIAGAQTQDEQYALMQRYTALRAGVLGMEDMGTAPNLLNAMKPTETKASDYELFQDASGNAKWVAKGSPVPSGWTKDRADKSESYMTITDGKEHRNILKSDPIPAGFRPWAAPQYGSGIVLPGTAGNPAQFVRTSGPNMASVTPLPDTVDKSAKIGKGGFAFGAMRTQSVKLGDVIRSTKAAIDAAKKYPDAFGLTRVSPAINQRIDPNGNEARRLNGRVASIVRNELFGSALTGNELQFARSWVPSDTDRSDKVIGDLTNLLRWAEAKQKDIEAELSSGNTPAANAPAGGAKEFKLPDGTVFRRP